MSTAICTLVMMYMGVVLYSQTAFADPIASRMVRSLHEEEESRALSPVSALRTVPSLLVPMAGPLMFLGAAYYLFSFLPTALPTIISILGLKARLLPYLTSLGLREALDLDNVGRRIEPALERGFDAIEVRDGECRRRAACEVGQWLARSHPTVAKVVDLFSDNVLRVTKYSDNLLQGARNNDCDSLFPDCPASPFRRFGAFL